ncbi:hypothetical protein JL09_g6451, partial [Pichia kudriavzevii]
ETGKTSDYTPKRDL